MIGERAQTLALKAQREEWIMVKLSRRSLLVGAGAGLTAINLGVRRTKAQTSKTLRLSITQSATAADYPAFERFAQFVANETQGEVTVEIFPSSQLGTEREATEQVKFGAIDMTTGGGDIQGFVPQVGLYYLPFLYPTEDCFASAWDIDSSLVAQKIAQLVLEGTQTIRALSFTPMGPRNIILRSRPVHTLADFKAVKIRVDGAATSTKTMQLLGASPVQVAYAEVYTALESGIVDAAENGLVTMVAQRWAEVGKYVALTGHNRTMNLTMINEQIYQALSAKGKEVLNEGARALARNRHELLIAADAEMHRKMEEMKVAFNAIADQDAWIEATKPMREGWAEEHGLEAELAAVTKMCS